MNIVDKIKNFGATLIGIINWEEGQYSVTPSEIEQIKKMLAANYYIILTRHNHHLSTFFIDLAHFGLTKGKKWGFYAHALMNLEGDDPQTGDDFRLMEATGVGVHYSTLDAVFCCDSVALLKPKSMTIDKWTEVLDRLKQQEGKAYDTLFDLKDNSKESCVELVRTALMAEPNYAVDFANFERMISVAGNLDPQMLYECPDFEVVYEVRHK
jgi:hypothetical protein